MNKKLIVYYSLFECSKSIILPGIAVNGTVAPEEVTKWLSELAAARGYMYL